MSSNSNNGTKKPTMLSLLKLPSKIGTGSMQMLCGPTASVSSSGESTNSRSHSGTHSVAPSDTQSDSDKLWYLKELFPTLSSNLITEVISHTETLDEAEEMLVERSRGKEVKPQKRKRVRILSESSNEDVTSPVRSPDIKKLELSIPEVNGGASGARGPLNITVSGIPIQVSFPVSSTGHNSKSRARRGSATSAGLVELSADHHDYVEEDCVSSDEEVVKSKTKRDMIVKFFNEGIFEELIRMPRCKEKKAELIISLRPFTSWDDLKHKFEGHKVLGTETLECCRELIETRQVILDLMRRCEQISERLSSQVNKLTESNNLGVYRIKQQPRLVNPDLKLKSYQLIGINWLLLLNQQKVDGILADEMGLGKTSQSIAFLAYLLEQGNVGPHLIIVPSSTLDNWGAELNRWCPSLKYITYHGSIADRQALRRRIFNNKASYNIVLSTYNVLTSTVDDKQIYKKLSFQYTILDEAHLLKNMTSQRFRNLMKIQSVRRLLLTGTPFQNDLVELMSLLCFVMPNMFINKEDQLRKMFTSLSRKGASSSGVAFEAERILHAKNIMKPFVLRRLKNDVLKELPKKTSVVEYVTLCPAQQDLYSKLANKYTSTVSNSETSRLDAISQLRLTANHHLLLRHKYTDDKLREIARCILKEPTHTECNEQYVFEDMQVMSDYEMHKLCLSYESIRHFSLTDEDILCSAKFQQLDKILPPVKQRGEKFLIFSQYKLVLNILEDYLRLRGHSYLRLDGSTQVSERLAMIDNFNADSGLFVFILSTRAGGLGINLTAANNVIIHDIDWNPHNDRQAEDRCHRLGQERDVKVTRLVSKGTVEAAMLAKADHKLDLERQIQQGSTKDENLDAITMLKETLSLWTTSRHS